MYNVNMQKGNVVIFILVGALVLAAALGGYYLRTSQDSTQKACTMEAKICPDGSSVGRAGPKCEFAPCPSISPNPSDETTNWKTYKDAAGGFEISYLQDMRFGNNPLQDQELVNIYLTYDYVEGGDNKKVVSLNINVSPNTQHITNNDLVNKINTVKGIGPGNDNSKEKSSLKPYKIGRRGRYESTL